VATELDVTHRAIVADELDVRPANTSSSNSPTRNPEAPRKAAPAIRLTCEAGIELLAYWLNWASQCRIAAFVELARKVRRRRVAIEEAFTSGTSNALVESPITTFRVLARVTLAFRSPDALIAMAVLALTVSLYNASRGLKSGRCGTPASRTQPSITTRAAATGPTAPRCPRS
jgi:hypothetical protein